MQLFKAFLAGNVILPSDYHDSKRSKSTSVLDHMKAWSFLLPLNIVSILHLVWLHGTDINCEKEQRTAKNRRSSSPGERRRLGSSQSQIVRHAATVTMLNLPSTLEDPLSFNFRATGQLWT